MQLDTKIALEDFPIVAKVGEQEQIKKVEVRQTHINGKDRTVLEIHTPTAKHPNAFNLGTFIHGLNKQGYFQILH